MAVLVGNVEYPNPDVIPNRPTAAPLGPGTVLAGEIGKSGPWYGLYQENHAHLKLAGLVIGQNMRVKKATGVAFATNAWGRFIPNPDVLKNDYVVTTVAALDEIHCIVLEARVNADTDVLIWGPMRPPFHVL